MIRPLLIITAVTLPGIIGGLAGAYIGAEYPDLFQMAHDQISWNAAIRATQWYGTIVGLTLISLGSWGEFREQLKQKEER